MLEPSLKISQTSDYLFADGLVLQTVRFLTTPKKTANSSSSFQFNRRLNDWEKVSRDRNNSNGIRTMKVVAGNVATSVRAYNKVAEQRRRAPKGEEGTRTTPMIRGYERVDLSDEAIKLASEDRQRETDDEKAADDNGEHQSEDHAELESDSSEEESGD